MFYISDWICNTYVLTYLYYRFRNYDKTTPSTDKITNPHSHWKKAVSRKSYTTNNHYVILQIYKKKHTQYYDEEDDDGNSGDVQSYREKEKM